MGRQITSFRDLLSQERKKTNFLTEHLIEVGRTPSNVVFCTGVVEERVHEIRRRTEEKKLSKGEGNEGEGVIVTSNRKRDVKTL